MIEREIRAALARLEDENRAVHQQLDLVLSSKGRRLILTAGHPVWTLRRAMSWLLGRKPLAAARDLWKEFRAHRISLSSIAPAPDGNGSETVRTAMQWSPELGISGEVREGLLCQGSSLFTFRTAVGPGARLRAHCALLPRAWDAYDQALEFRASVRVGSAGEQAASRVLYPLWRWSDRGWRPLTVGMPAAASGEAVVALETRAAGAGRATVPAAWGDLILEWPRSAADRRQLVRAAIRRLREWGVRGTIAYARGRRRLDDQAAAYGRWVSLHRLDDRALEELRAEVEALSYRPLISVITPVHDTAPDVLTACLESVRAQAYRSWEHCIADDGSTLPGTESVLRRYANDPRVRLVKLERTEHVSAASNAALSLATGEYVALLDHDDELAPEALAEVVRYLNAHPDADVIYSDEDKVDETGARCDPYFKPDWSPELFLSYMYTCHLMVVRRRLVEDIGEFRRGLEGAQDYDLLLRLMEKTGRIHHIPRILYHWRKGPASTASSGVTKPWALEAGRRALEDYARRAGLSAEVLSGPRPGMYRLRRSIRGEPLASIVIPTTGRPHGRRGDLLARCLRSLEKTAWHKLEVVVATDGELSDAAREALERLPHSLAYCAPRATFNFSQKVNEAVRQARGEHVVLFNDDLEVVSPDWLTAMLEYSQVQEVGAVGAKLVYPDGRLQHVGMLIGVCGLAAHAFHRYPGGSAGYAGSALVARNCSAVTAACLMTRRAVFDELGGLDEAFPVDYNDVDFCLRLRAAGYRIVFTPCAELIHHESASFGNRMQSAAELARMRRRWGAVLEHDPYYNPNLSKLFSDYRLQL
jgi:GT2 family glycosyltransferase